MKTKYKMITAFMILLDVLIKLIIIFAIPEMIGKRFSILGEVVEIYPSYNYEKANYRIFYCIIQAPIIITFIFLIRYIKYLIKCKRLGEYSLFCIYLLLGSMLERLCFFICNFYVLDYIAIVKYKIFDLTDFYLLYSGITLIVMLIKLSYKDRCEGCTHDKELLNLIKTDFGIIKSKLKKKSKTKES